MSDNKKYYYLKLKDNFFDTDEMVILESLPDGHLYSNILLKLYLRSIKNNGKLMLNERIPYNPIALAKVTRHSVGVVEKSLEIFKEMGLIEVLDNGAIFLNDIQNFIGESSTEADRKRMYRRQIDAEKIKIGQMSDECPDKYPPEREIELEIDIDIEKEREEERPSLAYIKSYCSDINSKIDPSVFYDYYTARAWKINGTTIDDWKALIRVWDKREKSKKGAQNFSQTTISNMSEEEAKEIIARKAARKAENI